jgi:hypothetical protein
MVTAAWQPNPGPFAKRRLHSFLSAIITAKKAVTMAPDMPSTATNVAKSVIINGVPSPAQSHEACLVGNLAAVNADQHCWLMIRARRGW